MFSTAHYSAAIHKKILTQETRQSSNIGRDSMTDYDKLLILVAGTSYLYIATASLLIGATMNSLLGDTFQIKKRSMGSDLMFQFPSQIFRAMTHS